MIDGTERGTIIESHLALARHCALRYHRGPEPLEDLEQVARLALVRACDTWKPGRGQTFSSYAVPCMIGAIKRHYRDAGWAVRVPRHLKELAVRVDRLARQTPPGTTIDQLADAAGVSPEEVVEARAVYRLMHSDSLDRPALEGEDGQTVSFLERLGTEDGEFERAEERASLDVLLSRLDSRDRLLITLYYRRGETQAQIGKRLGYSQMHVSRLLRRAVEHLVAVSGEAAAG